MGYPIFKGTGWATNSWSGTTGSIDYGTASGSVASGDLVILWINKDDDVAPGTPSDGGATFTLQAGAESNNAIYGTLYVKIADGNEGTTISWSSDSEEGVAFLAVIDGGATSLNSGTLSDVTDGGFLTRTNSFNTYYANLSDTGWGDVPTKYIEFAGWDSNSTLSTYPPALDDTTYRADLPSSGGAGAAGGAVASVDVESSAVPGTTSDRYFTVNDAEEGLAIVLAVRGVPPVTDSTTLDAVIKGTVTGYTNLARQIDYRTGTGSSSVNVEVPTHSEGDLLVAFIGIFENGTNRTLTPPAGWTQRWDEQRLGDQERLWTFTKTASSSEPASYTFSASGGTDAIGVMVSVENAEWVAGNASGNDSGSGTTSTTPTLSGEQGIFYGVHDTLVDTPWTATHSAPYEEVVAVQNLFSGSTYHVLSVGKAESLTTTSDAVSTLTWSESTGKVNTIFVAYGVSTLGIAVDAMLAQGIFRVDAEIVPKRFFVDAFIVRNVVFGTSAPISVGSSATTATGYGNNRSWTHTPGTNDRALVVLLGSWNASDVTSVTYGNLSMTERQSLGGAAGIHIFTLEGFDGRDDDVVRVTGNTQTGGSVFLRCDEPITYESGQTSAYANRNGQEMSHTYAVNGAPGGVYMAGMESSSYASLLTPISGTTIQFSRGGSNEGFRVGFGPQLTVGVDVGSTAVSALASVMYTGLSDGPGITLDAFKRIPTGDFTVDALRGQTFVFQDDGVGYDGAGITLDAEKINAYFLLDATIRKTVVRERDGATDPSVIGSLFTTGAGSKNWTATPNVYDEFVVNFNSRDSKWADFASLAYGGLSSTGSHTPGSNPNAGPYIHAFWWSPITSRASDTMSYTGSNNEGQHWVSVGFGTAFGVVTDTASAHYGPGAGSQNLSVDPNGQDCVALIWQATDSTSYAPGVPTIDNGRSVSQLHYRVNESHSSRLHVVDVLAADGSTTITTPNSPSERSTIILLVAAGGIPLDAYFIPGSIELDAVITKTQVFVGVDGLEVDAWKTQGGWFEVNALIKRTFTSLIHYDDMSPDTTDTWGSPDVGFDYAYSTQPESTWDKTSGIGIHGIKPDDGKVHFGDNYVVDKETFFEWAVSGRSNIATSTHWFGLNDVASLRYTATNNNSAGTPDRIQFYIDGALRGTEYYLPTKYSRSTPDLGVKCRVEGTTFKAKVWDKTSTSEPDWQITYDASAHYTPNAGEAYFRDESSYYFADGPWTHRFDSITIWSRQVPPLTLDAYFKVPSYGDTFTIDSVVAPWFGAGAFIQPYFRLDAVTYPYYLRLGDILVRAVIGSAGSFTADAVFAARPWFYADAIITPPTVTGSITADAWLQEQWLINFTVDAAFVTLEIPVRAWVVLPTTTKTDFLVLRSWVQVLPGSGSFTVDAWYDSDIGEQFTIDAEVVGLEKTGSLTADADVAASGEQRATFTVDTLLQTASQAIFVVRAIVEAHRPILLDAVKAGVLTLDASLSYIDGVDTFTADAAVEVEQTRSLLAGAVIEDAAGDYRGIHLDAVVEGTVGDPRLEIIEVLAIILDKDTTQTFTADASLSSAFTLDARFYQPLRLDAYIETTNVVVYPPSQEGDGGDTTGTAQSGSDGTALTATTFQSATADFTGLEGATIVIDGQAYVIASVTNSTTVVISGGTITGSGLDWYVPTFTDPDAEFGPSDVGATIVIGGVTYTIIEVVDETTVIVGGTSEWNAGAGLDWEVPSGSPTDPVGGDPPVTRAFQVMIEWSRPAADEWTEITGDVLWSKAMFAQSARVGPGTFELPLLGAFSQFVGGEEIRVSIDGFVVFGGYVADVSRGYVFEDDYTVPLTVLKGTDYNALLDRLLIYNAEWDEKKEGSGAYKTWEPFDKNTLDSTIIKTVARRYMSDPAGMGLDFETYVDTIETPAPTTKFQIESGMSLRNLLTEISRITEGVWWVDPYRNLHYHDRSTVTAPYPITDTDSGIACRGLKIQRSLSVMTNDVFVWGTQAYVDTMEGEIIYSRQTADRDWDEDWWQGRIDRVQEKIDKIKETPYDQRTQKQRTRLSALRDAKAVYERYLLRAQQSSEAGSVETYGRWQTAEDRHDLFSPWKVDKRAKAIMQRYSEPVVKGQATVFEPGFQAGQVVSVVSVSHGVAEDIVIRQMEISFVVGKEPVGDTYYAVPKYTLYFGLDPEEPWNAYEFLPYPDIVWPNLHFNLPIIRLEDDDEAAAPIWLDTFDRQWEDLETFGEAASERDEDRYWT